jgi:branched-chain amino acid transport system ATP-binding protein
MTESAPLLELVGLRRAFGRLAVIDDLSLSVPRGQALGVVGPNGAGKTTVLNLISGVLRPGAGVIRFAGEDVTYRNAAERARAGIGRTYQIPRPFGEMTVFENTLVGPMFASGRRGAAAHAAAAGALERVGLADKANKLAGSLPLLDRKRLELARALAASPTLILLDEIAGGLTEHEVPAVVETVQQLLAEGVTVIWIEHIVHALVAVVDRLICLANGRLLADGPPREVLASAEVVDVYLGSTFDPELPEVRRT